MISVMMFKMVKKNPQKKPKKNKKRQAPIFGTFLVIISGRLLTTFLVYGALTGSRGSASVVPLRGWIGGALDFNGLSAYMKQFIYP